jgi:hypothetical protein
MLPHMRRELGFAWFLVLSGALATASAQEVVPARLAALGPRGLLVRDAAERAWIASSAGLETFAWDRGGLSVVATQGGELLRIELASGSRRVLASRGLIRFPDVAPRSGRIAFAYVADADADAGEQRAGAARWRIAYVQPDGSGFTDAGPGYDPCWSHDEQELWLEDFDAHGPALYALVIPRHSVDRGLEPGAMIWSSQRHLHAGAPGSPDACYSTGRDYDRFASFSPAGRHLLFFREDECGRSGIVLRELASASERWLDLDGRVDIAAFAPAAPPPRTIEDFRALSRSAAGAHELSATTRLDGERYAARLRVLRDDLARVEAPALLLPGILTLDAREAGLLIASGAVQLVLPDLADLDAPTARELARWRTNAEQAFLALDGLRDANPSILRELGSLQGWGLSLGGLERLTRAQAEALATLRVGWLDLRGVRELEEPVARALLGGALKFVDLRGLEKLEERARAVLEAASESILFPKR